MTGFETVPDALRRRAGAVADVESSVRRALDAAATTSAPDAYGLLCSFFPALLAPAQVTGRAALGAGADAARALGEALHAAAATYEDGDAAGASVLRGDHP